jgi:hypothetical protein
MTPTIAEIEARLRGGGAGKGTWEAYDQAAKDIAHLLSELHAARQRVSELEGELRHLVNLVEPALENGVRIPGLATCNGAKLVLSAMQKGAV